MGLGLPVRDRRRSSADESASPDEHKASARAWPNSLRSLSNPHFRMLWMSVFFFWSASQMDVVARSWLAYDISGSAATLGLVMLIRGLPQIAFAMFAGVIAERFDKRKVMLFTQISVTVLALLNAVLVHLQIIQIWELAVIGCLQGLLVTINYPSRTAYIPHVVGKGHFSNALALTANATNINRVLVPVLAGVLIAWNAAVAFYAIAVFYGLGVFMVWALPKKHSTRSKPSGAVSEMVAGLKYLWRSATLRLLLLLSMLGSVLGLPFQTMLTVFQVEVLHVGPAELGVMFTGAGVGSLLGSIAATRLSDHRRRVLLQLLMGVAFGLSLLAFSLSSNYPLSVALLAFVGFAGQGFLILNNVLIMLETDPPYYGRVIGIYGMTMSLTLVAVMPLGAAADLYGAPAVLGAAGVLLAVTVGFVFFKYPAHRRPLTSSADLPP